MNNRIFISNRKKKMSKSQCFLCGKRAASHLSQENEYLEGFCEACIISMANEKKFKSIDNPYSEIEEKIQIQIDNIETLLLEILPKKSKSSGSSSITSDPVSKTTSSPVSKSDLYLTSSPKVKTDKKVLSTEMDVSDSSSKVPPSSPPQKQNKKPKSTKKYIPKITPTDDS